MKLDPFARPHIPGAPACTCPTVRSRIDHALAGTTPGPCPLHNPDGVAAAAAQQQRDEARAEADRLRTVREEAAPELADPDPDWWGTPTIGPTRQTVRQLIDQTLGTASPDNPEGPTAA